MKNLECASEQFAKRRTEGIFLKVYFNGFGSDLILINIKKNGKYS